ncbi:MAG: alkaline phosphatase family protein [Clostridiales bacterium]|nr:alkaline phosphatase family protein [Clostridiales bacterium]
MSFMNKKTAKHVIFISYDAFSEDNWEKAKSLPNLSKLIKKGAYTNKLRSVYPTLTYVIHTTYVTGLYPDKHGISHNNPLQPFIPDKSKEWYWFRKSVKAPTIYDLAKEKGLRVASILWPVTGKASIKYNLPEVVAINKENQVLKMIKNGSPFYVLSMALKYKKVLKGIDQPYLDNFSTLLAMDTIKNKKPNLLMLHLIDLDDTKHKTGTDSKEVDQTLKRMDERLGGIIKAVKDAGIEEDTVFVISGDHGQINVDYRVYLNNLLLENNLIYEENGQWKWRAYLQSTGGSAYLHLKEGDKEAESLAIRILNEAKETGEYGIEKIYTRKDLDNLRVHRNIPYMIEAKKGYSFEDYISFRTLEDLNQKKIRFATHGYHPDKDNYSCNLIISGDIIKDNYSLGQVEMVDIAPTIASILGIDLANTDGRVLEDIFK